MNLKFRVLAAGINLCVLLVTAGPGFGEIILRELSQQEAKDDYGITMHARKNGDAGIKVWLRFKQDVRLRDFTYAELQMADERGQHLLSARLQPHPVHYRQPRDVTTVAFSADAGQLARCRFWVVCYGGNEGGVGYVLKVSEFLDLENPVTEE